MVSILDRFNPERLLVLFILVVTSWIFFGSFSLERSGSELFPQLTGGITLSIIIIFLLFRAAPDRVQKKFTTDREAIRYGSTDADITMDEKSIMVVYVLFTIYIFTVYIIGFLLSTPLFTYIILWYFSYKNRKNRILITALLTGMVIVSYFILRIPFDQGIIFDYLLY